MKTLTGTELPKEQLKTEWKGAERHSELSLGETVLFHRYFFKTVYIRYTDIVRAYVRIESGESGEYPTFEHSLVLIDREGTEHVLHVEREISAEKTIESMAAAHPHIICGKQ